MPMQWQTRTVQAVVAERVPGVLGVSLSAVLAVADNNSWFAECCLVGIDVGYGVGFVVAAERIDGDHRLAVADEVCVLFRISLRLRKHAQPTKMIPFPPVSSFL